MKIVALIYNASHYHVLIVPAMPIARNFMENNVPQVMTASQDTAPRVISVQSLNLPLCKHLMLINVLHVSTQDIIGTQAVTHYRLLGPSTIL